MNAIAFDTHAHVKRLVGAGMTEDQAEAVVDAVRQTAELPTLDHLATKADLQLLKTELQAELTGLRGDTRTEISGIRGEVAVVRGDVAGLRGEMKGLRGELIWWIIGTGVVSTVAHLLIK